jgi:hypothetical protein
MKRSRHLLVVICVGIAVLVACYWLGLRQGADFGVEFASTLSGSSSLIYLQAIQDGKFTIQDTKVNAYLAGLESQVDEALLQNYHLEGHPAFRFLPSLWRSDAEAARREYLTRLANYRKEHPSPMRPEANEALLAKKPELRQSMGKTQDAIAEMVSHYVGKPPQPQ